MTRIRLSASAWMLGVSGWVFGCAGEPTTAGLEEPIRVLDAQFREDDLPGLAPLTADQVNAGVMPTPPSISAISLPNSVIPVGEPSRTISGRASLDATAVAVRFADAGSGYWLVPTGSADVVNQGEVEWRMNAAFGRDVVPGLHRLLFAAVDERGHAGTQGELNVCLTPEVPDDGNSCDPTVSPPALVVSLGWDAPVDLDLRVITPAGKVVDSKHPTTAVEDENGNFDLNAAGTGLIPNDSFANCVAEGRRRESLVFETTPESGTYLVYANLFDACGQDSVHFDVTLNVAVPGQAEGTFAVEETYRQAGELQAVHANGGAKLGLFVTSFNAH